MIKEGKVLVGINYKNFEHYKSLGYDMNSNKILINTNDVNITSKIRITAICEICQSENPISINKYYVNKNRNDKGYYSCFNCKNIEKEKTCLKVYGVKSYSMTDEYRESESQKWKGIQKGGVKGKETMLKKYGVDSYFKTDESKLHNSEWMSSDEFKEKSKETMIERYGVDSFSKTDEFKKLIDSKKDIIVEKIKQTFMEKYGVDSIFKTNEFKINSKSKLIYTEKKRRETCLERYGVDNVSKDKDIHDSIIKTKESRGLIIPDILLNDWNFYKKLVRKLTNRVKKKLYESWDGYDYYDGELIKGYQSNTHTHSFYPTIDQKISTYYGFINGILPEEISDISNLCITKRYINSIKNSIIESEFSI